MNTNALLNAVCTIVGAIVGVSAILSGILEVSISAQLQQTIILSTFALVALKFGQKD